MTIKITVMNKKLADRAEKIMSGETNSDRVFLHNNNLNQCEHEIVFGDFNSIAGVDEIAGTILLRRIIDDSGYDA